MYALIIARAYFHVNPGGCICINKNAMVYGTVDLLHNYFLLRFPDFGCDFAKIDKKYYFLSSPRRRGSRLDPRVKPEDDNMVVDFCFVSPEI